MNNMSRYTQGQIPFKPSELLSTQDFIKHCESRGVFDVSNNFNELESKNVLVSVNGKYPKYLAYEIWKYWDELPKRNLSPTYEGNKEKMVRLRLNWHRRLIQFTYLIQEYTSKISSALKPDINDVQNDKSLSRLEKMQNIKLIIQDYVNHGDIDFKKLAIDSTKFHKRMSVSKEFINDKKSLLGYIYHIHEHYIYPLVEDIWRLKGNFDLYTLNRFNYNQEDLFTTETIRKVEYKSYSPLVRLAQDCWNVITVFQWYIDDISKGKVKLDLGRLCKFCSKPIPINKEGRPRTHHSKEQDPECYRQWKNADKTKSRKKLKQPE